jgi:hypothetical protein
MKRNARSWFSDISGSMAVVLPLMIALGVAGAALWAYHEILRSSASGRRASLETLRVAHNVVNRVKTYLTAPGPATDPANNCTAAIDNAFLALRNLNTVPPAVTFSYPLVAGTNQIDQTCLLPDYESPTAGPPLTNLDLDSIRVTVFPVPGSDDLVRLSRLVTISVSASSTGIARTVSWNETVRLKAASLSDYVLVMVDNAGAQQISVNTALVNFMSPVYFAFPSGSLRDLSVLTDAPASTTFFQPIDIRGKGLVLSAPGNGLSMINVRKLLRGGVRTRVFDDLVTRVLPFMDKGPSAAGGQNPAWQQPVYYWSGATGLGYPMPWLAGLVSGEPGIQAAFNGILPDQPASPPPPPPSAAIDFLNPPVAPYVPTSNTCATAPAGNWPLRNQLVFNRSDQDLTIALNSAGNSLLCGFIAARNVTFNLTGGGPNYFFGMIIAKTLTITSGGGAATLYLANPLAGDIPFQDNLLPAGQTFSGLTRQMRAQVSGPARNFLVPILHRRIGLNRTSARFRPGGMLSILTLAGGVPGLLQGWPGGVCAGIDPVHLANASGLYPMNPPFCYSWNATGIPWLTNRCFNFTTGPGEPGNANLGAANKADMYSAFNDELVYRVDEVKP